MIGQIASLPRRLHRLWRIRLHRASTRIGLPDYTQFSIFSIITGVAAGLAAVFFHETIAFFSEIFLTKGPEVLAFLGAGALIMMPAIGMLIQSLMVALAPETSKRRGVLDVIKAVAIRDGYIPFRTTLFHFLAPAICIGSGGTVGPEGPTAQIGAGLASKLGRLFGLSDLRRRMFTAAGSGAAIAAVFNTPLGGIFFALEVILLNDFHTTTFSALILASVTASAISHIFLGNQPRFSFEAVSIGPYEQLYLYAVMGIGAGLLSLAYIKYSDKLHKIIHTQILRRISQWMLMAIIGLLLGCAGYFFRDIFGIGYNTINHILAGVFSWKVILILLLLKFIFVPLILESGAFGGVFAPSLFIGACYGYLFAFGLNYFFHLNLHTPTFTLVAMGAVLGGINSIPLSAILIIFEMSKEYAFILPLMLAVVISTMIVQLIVKDSIHSVHLKQQGYRISRGVEMNFLLDIQVKEVMRQEIVLVPETTPLPSMVSQCIESNHGTYYVVDADKNLVGTISSSELRALILDYEHLRGTIIASDIALEEVVTVQEDDNLDYVLHLFGSNNLDEFPVVDANDPHKAIGTIWRQDVLAVYQRESIKHNITDGFARSLKTLKKTHSVQVSDQYSIIERKAPKEFFGKTLAQLRLRSEYGLEILMIHPERQPFDAEETEEMLVPAPNYAIKEGDSLVLFGRDEHLAITDTWL